MAEHSKIEWTDATWTPIRARFWEIQNDGSGKERIGWHCEHVSEGCRNCYAEAINRRLGTGRDFKPGELFREEKRGHHNGEVQLFLDEGMLTLPLRWRRPRMVFVCSMSDLFADFVPDAWIDRVFAVMALCPQHTFQVLTKRPERMRAYVSDLSRARRDGRGEAVAKLDCDQPLECLPWPLHNVWCGTSCEDQATADERIPHLLATPSALRFVSLEPLLGPVNLWSDANYALPGGGIGSAFNWGDGVGWVIVGGESGPNARPMHPGWARSLRDQCQAAGVPFFMKQWGKWRPAGPGVDGKLIIMGANGHVRPIGNESFYDDDVIMARADKQRAGRLLDGRTWDEMPILARTREAA